MVEHERATDAAVGVNVARLRQARGISQAELADMLGVAQQTVQKIEKGSRPLKFVEATELAKALRVSLSALSDRPEAAVAESNLIRLNRELGAAFRLSNSTLAELADALVSAALELATNQARPDPHKAPEWRASSLRLSMKDVSNWAARLDSALVEAVRRAASDVYQLPLPATATVDELVTHIAETKVRLPDAEA